MTRINAQFRKARSKIVEFMKETPNSTLGEISEGAGVAPVTAKKHVNALVEGGLASERAKVTGGYCVPAYTFLGAAGLAVGADETRTKVDEIADEIAAISSPYNWSIMIDGESYRPEDVRLFLVLDGTDTDLKSGKIDDYGIAYKDLPVLDWHASIYHTEPINVLMDGDAHELMYFDQRYKVAVRGSVILISKEIQKAKLSQEGAEVLYEYHVNGLAPGPQLRWQPGYLWVGPTETLDGEVRK